jgi:hypothetical protein
MTRDFRGFHKISQLFCDSTVTHAAGPPSKACALTIRTVGSRVRTSLEARICVRFNLCFAAV